MDRDASQLEDERELSTREEGRTRATNLERQEPERREARPPFRAKKPRKPKPHPRRDGESRQQQPSEENEAPKPRAFFRRPILLVIGAAIVLLAILGGIVWWLHARKYEDTDDAFIDTHIVRVASQIAGQVVAVHVEDNQNVQAGQLLVEIDPADARSRLAQIMAQEAQAETQMGQAQAQIRTAEANYQQAISTAAGARAQAENAAREVARYRELLNINARAAAQSQVDQAETQARNTEAQAQAAAKQVQAVAAQRTAAEAQLKGAQAQIEALKAQVSQAQISLGYTRILASVAGHIAQRTVAVGTYVSPGQQMMAIVPLQIWVTANFKETQLAYMRPGQSVDVQVDACPNAKIQGHVDSIQRGAGQAFALLPPENATGNFVKVVQRVPVKIVLDTVPSDCPLGPGMSVEPTVTVR
jgi:membrane fusion protein (multidrug efflux system)